jgi:metallophosphoesterase superfamily enzyme
LPAHSLSETRAKLARLLARGPIGRLIVAGDLVESASPCRRTARDVQALACWLAGRGVELVALAGNHDPRQVPALSETREVAGWTIAHGHRPIAAARSISGHIHPVLRAWGVTAPCFLVGPRMIVLPAFSPNAAGGNVLSGLLPQPRPTPALRCIAGTGCELLDFGPLDSLAARLAGCMKAP